MNVVFVSDDSSGINLLKSELNKHARASHVELSPDEKNSSTEITQILVEQVSVTPDGVLALPDDESFPGDIVVLDSAFTGKRTEKIISDTTNRAPGVPVILLTDPANESVEVDAINAGATDCIAKTDQYLDRLLPIIEREIGRRQRTGETEDSGSREDRLRQIVEKLPIGITVIAPDGTFLAINQAGLKLLGAAKLDQIIGKKIHHLVNKEDHDRTLAFLTAVGGGKKDSISLEWKGLAGKATDVQLEATPMRRQGIKGDAVLAAIYSLGESAKGQDAKKDALDDPRLKQALQEFKVRWQNLQKKHSLEKSASETALKKLETQSREWEEKAQTIENQHAALQSALEDSEKQRKKQVEDFEAERARWEETRKEWEQNTRETQEQQSGMQSTLQEAGKQLSAIEATLQEKEEQRAALEASLRESEDSRKQQAEDFEAERARWEETRKEWEQKGGDETEKRIEMQSALQEAREQLSMIEAALQEREDQRASLEASLQEKEDQRAALETALQEEKQQRAALEPVLQEAEGKRAALEAALQEEKQQRAALEPVLQEAEEKRVALEAALQEEKQQRAALETALQEKEDQRAALEPVLQEAEEKRVALEAALQEEIEKRKQQAEAYESERTGWEQSRGELEERIREVEGQRAAVQAILRETEEKQAALETALQEVEESRKQQAEVFDAERSRWEQTRQEWEEKFRESEKQHDENLQTAVREVETRYERLSEESREKELQLEEIRQEMQQLQSGLEIFKTDLSVEKTKYQKLSRVSSVGTLVTDTAGRVLECNDSAARMFGYAGAEEALSQTDGENSFRIFAFQGALGERLRREGRLENIEWSSLSRNGRLIRLREDALLVEHSEGDAPRLERILTDITQVYTLSEEIRRIRKVESTGDLLAAAVKNLKNICESLADSSKLLKASPDDGNTIQQVAEKLLKDADRGAKNVRQFQSVSAKTDRIPAVINMNEILEDNDPVLRSLVGENIDLQIHSSADRSLIMADRQETVQLISNLVLSSMKTLPLGGTVSIETDNIEVDASESEHPENLPSGTFVLMTISADGFDVLPERRMSYNKSIMDRIGGWISTTTDPQTGNVHRLYFPRVESFADRTTLTPNASEAESYDS